MAATILLEDQIRIPTGIQNLTDFRRWAVSDCFPERGRIDFLSGCIEVDMSPEDLFCHGTLKGEIYATLHERVKNRRMGFLFVDRTRVSCPPADLSVEPDVVFLSQQAIDTGRVRLVPKAGAGPGRYIEVEGPPDLVLEVVNDSSVTKDTSRLLEAYFKAGVAEYWLADARAELTFRIHHRGQANFQQVPPDAEGYQRSLVLSCCFRLDGQRDQQGHWAFDLRVSESGS